MADMFDAEPYAWFNYNIFVLKDTYYPWWVGGAIPSNLDMSLEYTLETAYSWIA